MKYYYHGFENLQRQMRHIKFQVKNHQPQPTNTNCISILQLKLFVSPGFLTSGQESSLSGMPSLSSSESHASPFLSPSVFN